MSFIYSRQEKRTLLTSLQSMTKQSIGIGKYTMFQVTILWSPMYGLQVRVNGLQINSTYTQTEIPEGTSQPAGLNIGCDIYGSQCTPMSVDDVYFVQNVETPYLSMQKITAGNCLN